MNFKKRPPLTPREIRILIFLGLITLVAFILLAGINIGLSQFVPGGGGFFVAWEGARARLFLNTDPYSHAVSQLAQEHAYGRLAVAGENPYFLTIPFFLLPFYFPFALIPNPAVAHGLWMLLSESALVLSALLIWRLIEWEPPRLFLIFFVLLSVIGFYSVTSLLDGSPIILLGLIYLLILSALSSGQDEMAGALLVFTLFYWEVGLPFSLLIFWKVFSESRWRTFAGFGMLLTVLLVLSFLIYPGWFLPFMTAVIGSLRAEFGVNTAGVLSHLSPLYGLRVSQALTVLTIVMLGFEWAATRDSDFRRFVWAMCLTLAATPLLGLRTELSNLIVMFPGLALIFVAAANRWKMGYWLTSLLALLAFFVPWSFFMQWLLFHNQIAHDLLFLFFPLFMVVGLYWTRWWFIRPPRTWMDHIRLTVN